MREGVCGQVRRSEGWTYVLLGFLAAGTLAGCIFSTREPESTGGESSVPWVPPEYLYAALVNMKAALEAKVVDNYERSFSPDHFELILDDADLGALGGENPFETWSASQEAQRMEQILGGTKASLSVEWIFTAETDSIYNSDTEQYYKDLGYELVFTEGTKEAVYAGKVNLYFEDDGTGQWFITKWVDKRDPTQPEGVETWGMLRARGTVEFPSR